MTITAEQVILIGVVAAVISQVIKILTAQAGLVIDRKVITIILFVLSIGLSAVWAAPAIPALPAQATDPAVYSAAIVTWVGNIIALASAIIGFATLIYNLLLQKVFDALGWNSQTITAKLADSK